jgi:hypothetical protein
LCALASRTCLLSNMPEHGSLLPTSLIGDILSEEEISYPKYLFFTALK